MPESPALPRPPWPAPRAVGLGAAVSPVTPWTASIVNARASASRSLTLSGPAWMAAGVRASAASEAHFPEPCHA